MNPFRIAILLLLCLVATACGATASQEATVASTPTTAAVPEATATSAQEDVATATLAPAEATETPEVISQAETDWLTVEGKTEDNLTFLGNPEAPVTLIDHSDFL